MALHAPLQQALDTRVGSQKYTVTNATATISAANCTLTHEQIRSILEMADVGNHKVSLSAGALSIQPK